MEEEIVFNHTGHKALWNWLADNPDKDKVDYFMSLPSSINTPRSFCYACEYSREMQSEEDFWGIGCNCPLVWDTPSGGCISNASLYMIWEFNRERLDVRSSMARKIANLPVKEGIKCV